MSAQPSLAIYTIGPRAPGEEVFIPMELEDPDAQEQARVVLQIVERNIEPVVELVESVEGSIPDTDRRYYRFLGSVVTPEHFRADPNHSAQKGRIILGQHLVMADPQRNDPFILPGRVQTDAVPMFKKKGSKKQPEPLSTHKFF